MGEIGDPVCLRERKGRGRGVDKRLGEAGVLQFNWKPNRALRSQ